MLSNNDMKVLKRPFAARHHEFLKGRAYITEMAITERIEQVDPSWSLEQIALYNREGAGMQIICTMRLTIKGVSRDGVGMSSVVVTKPKEDKLKEGKTEVSEANEAEKSAATDAMKRAARLFGIGRYLLNLPEFVTDERSMARYLSTLKESTPEPEPTIDVSTGEIMDAPAPVPAQPQPAPAVVTPTPARDRDPLENEEVLIRTVTYHSGGNQTAHWIGHATIEDPYGMSHPIEIHIWEEDRKVLEAKGYPFPKTFRSGDMYMNVIITTADRGMRRINLDALPARQMTPPAPPEARHPSLDENPPVNPFNGAQAQPQAAAPETAQKPTSKEPDWFQKTLKEQFGLFKTYAQEHIYGTNLYHMKGSLKKHGVVDAKDKLTPAWENKTIGEAVKLLNDLRQFEQTEKAS